MKSGLVIVCNAWYGDERGGAYRIASDLALHCAAKGREVYYVSARRSVSGGVERSEESGVKLWRYAIPRHSGEKKSFQNLLGHIHGTRSAVRAISEHASSPMILNGHTPLQYFALVSGAKYDFKRRVLSVHSPFFDEYIAEKNGKLSFWRDLPASLTLKHIEKRVYQASDLIQCDSQYTTKLLLNNYSDIVKGRMEVCPGYVERRPEKLISLSRQEARQTLADERWNDKGVYFFTARRHVPRSGLDTLIRAAAWLKDKLSKDEKFRVMIAGDGPFKEAYQRQSVELGLSGEVCFLGALSEDKLVSSYRAADCFVLPTRSLECFGLVILEALATGTPVIATPVGAIPEVLGPFTQGLSKENTAESLGERMLSFMRSKEYQQTSNESLYVNYAKQYEKSLILNRLEALITCD